MRQEIHKCYAEVCLSHKMFAPLLLGGVQVVLKKTLGLIKVFYLKVNNKKKKHITTNNKKKTTVKWKNTNLVILEPNPRNKNKQESYIFIKSLKKIQFWILSLEMQKKLID